MSAPKFSGHALRKKISALTSDRTGEEVPNLFSKIEWLSGEVGLSSNTIWRYLRGEFPAHFPKLKQICDALGCHPSELLLPSDRLAYESVLLNLQELEDEVLDVLERNLALTRLSREVLRWQSFFEIGRFEVDVEEELAERQKSAEIDAELKRRGLGE